MAENSVMVWTDLAVSGYPQAEIETIVRAWFEEGQYYLYP